ncbi:MAG: hypothetical protein HYZ62_01510 [Candidatus Andersenbacteria bacterium]|nr:hypothetical protein [Candidatus Andersenbacteria bacterium]
MSTTIATPVTFLVPRSLTWDKLCALYLSVRITFPEHIGTIPSELIKKGLFDIHFHGDPNRPDTFIDIDVIVDYKTTKHGSATAKVAFDGNLTDWTVTRLVQLVNQNNRDGKLKQVEHSFVQLIRDRFSVGTGNPSKARRVATVDLFWPVMNIFFQACGTGDGKLAMTAMDNPFTLAAFAELCQLANADSAQVETWTSALVREFERADDLQEFALERAAEIEAFEFDVPLYSNAAVAKGHFIESDNTRLASEYLSTHADVMVLVVRRSNGNVAIFCRGAQVFDDLYRELERLEPALWHHETRFASPMLLNGSGSRHAPATGIYRDPLIALIQRYHQHRSRKYQERRPQNS